jgi:hypothetical protein
MIRLDDSHPSMVGQYKFSLYQKLNTQSLFAQSPGRGGESRGITTLQICVVGYLHPCLPNWDEKEQSRQLNKFWTMLRHYESTTPPGRTTGARRLDFSLEKLRCRVGIKMDLTGLIGRWV